MCDNEYDNILNVVKEQLKLHPDFELYVTGHSLGGALCTLCGFLLSYEIKSKIHVVSFASPRVGDSKWKKVFDSRANLRHHRITNRRDIVTLLNGWFKHVGDNIRVKEIATMVQLVTAGGMFLFLNVIASKIMIAFIMTSLKNQW